MTVQQLVEAEPAAPTDSKWFSDVSPGQPVCEVASRVLDARLKAVGHASRLAAENGDDDVEHVHRLRIAVRRAVAAVRVFSGLLDEAEVEALRERLQRMRVAADNARNWDVIHGRFSQADGYQITARIVDQVRAFRREAQGPIVAVCQEIIGDGYEEKVEQLVREVESHHHGEGRRRFGRHVHSNLNPVVKKFFKAAESDLTTDESLHGLRVQAKKLRYTMEVVAAAFGSRFRTKLYPQLTRFQDLLGTVNDHATAKELFGDWLAKSDDVLEKAFLEGLLLAEELATKDLRTAFLVARTPKVVSELKRQFRLCC